MRNQLPLCLFDLARKHSIWAILLSLLLGSCMSQHNDPRPYYLHPDIVSVYPGNNAQVLMPEENPNSAVLGYPDEVIWVCIQAYDEIDGVSLEQSDVLTLGTMHINGSSIDQIWEATGAPFPGRDVEIVGFWREKNGQSVSALDVRFCWPLPPSVGTYCATFEIESIASPVATWCFNIIE